MNRSKDLRDLFRQSLINERNRPHINYVRQSEDFNCGGILDNVHRIPNQYDDKSVRIYFYEWSDPNKAPRAFYQLDSFDNFLKTSGIYLEFYQKEIIRNLGTAFIICYTGTKNLNIRGTYMNMINSLAEHDSKKLVSSIQKPNLIFEPNGRYPENDGTFFG